MSSRTRYTSHFIASDDAAEVAFLSVDVRPDCDFVVLYEIYVDPSARRRGVGTEIVKLVEAMTLDQGRKRITLYPEPLDSTISRRALVAWYQRRGFRKRRGELEKQLSSVVA